jgi:hypothetical protein
MAPYLPGAVFTYGAVLPRPARSRVIFISAKAFARFLARASDLMTASQALRDLPAGQIRLIFLKVASRRHRTHPGGRTLAYDSSHAAETFIGRRDTPTPFASRGASVTSPKQIVPLACRKPYGSPHSNWRAASSCRP